MLPIRSLVVAPLALGVALLAANSAPAQTRPDAVLLRMPDVSRELIAFRYAGDIWVVDKRGGVARPLTSSPGNESFPKFSPDGKRIAFMGGYDGGSDLYVIGLDGGLPTRITHHPASEVLCDWMPDGKELLFFSPQVSGQQRAPKMFRVSASGGQPAPMPIPYGTFGAVDDTATWLAYTPLTQSEFRTWKRYQGGMAQDIWLFDLKTNASKRATDFPGTDALPMWHGAELVFLSDRGKNGKLNLWSYDPQKGSTAQLTDFGDFDVRFPSIGPDDVVFENGGKLYRYEFSTRKPVAVDVMIPRDRPKLRAQSVDVKDLVVGATLGPYAKRVAFEARGELFSVPVDKGVTRNLTHSDGVAEREPDWSPDGKWIAYVCDRSGEYEVCVRRADGQPFRWQDAGEPVEEHALTAIGAGWKFAPTWSPDSKRLAFCNEAGALQLVALGGGAPETIDEDPDGQPFDVQFSPDSRWLTWAHRGTHSRLSVVFLYDTREKVRTEATSGRFNDQSPSFEGGGEWLFYLSDHSFAPIYSDFDDTWIYTNTRNLMAVPLKTSVENPWAPRNDEEEADKDKDKKDSAGKSDAHDDKKDEKKDDKAAGAKDEPKGEADKSDDDAKKGEDAKKDEEPKPVEIDLDGFEARATIVPVDAGELASVRGAKGKAVYLRQARTGSSGEESKLVFYDLKEKEKDRKEQVILSGVDGFQLAARADKVLVALSDHKGYAVVDLGKDQKADDKLDLSGLTAVIDPRHEWEQVLTDAGRIMRDFFYEPHMHGSDWNAIVQRYRGALADATSRDDLQYLMGEMISELNVGHAYINAPPSGLETAGPPHKVGLLGCDWALENGAYRIARILGGSAADADARSPLSIPGVDAREGDYLLAVNGAPPDPAQDVYAAFDGQAGRTCELVLNAAPSLDGHERRVVVQPLESEVELRYRDWVEQNRKLVAQMSEGKVGYVHVPDTGIRGQNELVRQFMSQYNAPALLVDERWNSGGQIPTRFIELLNRPITNYWAIRHGEDWIWPPVGHRGPKAMLINGSSGSGGDAFPYYFRQAGLGKLIGMRTWGGLVGLSGNPGFIDGSSISVPRFAFYERDGTWGVEGYGVPPDIEVVDDPALMVHGEDPQLVAGVQHLLKELGAHPLEHVARPAAPDRHGAGIKPEDR